MLSTTETLRHFPHVTFIDPWVILNVPHLSRGKGMPVMDGGRTFWQVTGHLCSSCFTVSPHTRHDL